MNRRLSVPIAAVSLVAVVVASAGTGAVAQRLIGSKDVADNSLTSKDIKNRTLTGKDVKDGSLTTADVAGLSAGTGATGPQGPKGETGPVGSGGAVETLRWDVVFTSNGAGEVMDTTTIDTSSESFPKGTELKALDVQVTGDFSACTESRVNFDQGNQTLGYVGIDSIGSLQVRIRDFVTVQPGPLRIFAGCSNSTGPPDYTYTRLAVPSFTATILFQVSHPSTTVTRAFD